MNVVMEMIIQILFYTRHGPGLHGACTESSQRDARRCKPGWPGTEAYGGQILETAAN
jgi:hypothetical protein